MTYSDEITTARRNRDQLIIKLTEQGKSIFEISSALKCGLSTVSNIRAKYGLHGRIGRPRRAGEPKAGE